MGVPQGSILSVTLFSLKINSLATVLVLKNDTLGSFYVVNFVLYLQDNLLGSYLVISRVWGELLN